MNPNYSLAGVGAWTVVLIAYRSTVEEEHSVDDLTRAEVRDRYESYWDDTQRAWVPIDEEFLQQFAE